MPGSPGRSPWARVVMTHRMQGPVILRRTESPTASLRPTHAFSTKSFSAEVALPRWWDESAGPRPLLQLLVVQRIEDGGVPHLVDGSLAPVHVTRRLVRISRIERRVVPRRRELDPGGNGQRHRRAEPVEALPVEIPVVDVNERLDGLVLHPCPDLHLSTEHVHVRMDGDQLHRPANHGSRLDLVSWIAGRGCRGRELTWRRQIARIAFGSAGGDPARERSDLDVR